MEKVAIEAAPASTPQLARFERKFFIEDNGLVLALDTARHHPSLFREVYAPRWINNIYFDTAGLRAYRENQAGVSPRLKVRLRWYGELTGHIRSPTLELKHKAEAASWKESRPIPPFTYSHSGAIDVRGLVRASTLGSALANIVDSMDATLVNRYLRRYFLSADGRFRLTIDSELSYTRPTPQGILTGDIVEHYSAAVVEVKYDISDDFGADSVCSALPFPLTKSSKYSHGIQLFHGE